MTFRIDWIAAEGPGVWVCSFKGFRGQGIYGRAQLDIRGLRLLVASTMDSTQSFSVVVEDPPAEETPDHILRWFARQLEQLGWGPEVDQKGNLAPARALGTSTNKRQSIRRMFAKPRLLEESQFVKQLGWTHRKLAQAVTAHRIFFIEHEGRRLFPAFYVDPANNRRQLEAVTKLLRDLPAGSKLQFFTNRRGSLSRQTPLQALRSGKVAEVKAAARGFAQG